MRLSTQIRIIGALARAEEKKRTLQSCQTCPLKEECYHGALCQKALSESMGISSQSLSKVLKDPGGLVEIFVLRDKPKNHPRKFIKLRGEPSNWLVGGAND